MTPTPGDHDGLGSYPAFEDGTQDEASSRAGSRRLWLVFFAIAFLIFELTANPSLALSFGCIKFGWDDFRRARRLKRDDPSRIRGKVCARFATAWGCLKVSLVAIALMFAIVIVEGAQQGPGGKAFAGPGKDPPATFITATITVMIGLSVSAFVSTFAVASALRHGLKVWVGGRSNRAKLVLASALLTWATVLGLALTLFVLAHPPKADLTPVQFLVAFFSVLFGVPLALLVLLERLEHRVVAVTPLECWGWLPEHLIKASEPDAWERDLTRGGEIDPFRSSW